MSIENDPQIEIVLDQRLIDFMKQEDNAIKIETSIDSYENNYGESTQNEIKKE